MMKNVKPSASEVYDKRGGLWWLVFWIWKGVTSAFGGDFRKHKPAIEKALDQKIDAGSVAELADRLIVDDKKIIELFALLRSQELSNDIKWKIFRKCIYKLKLKNPNKPNWTLTHPEEREFGEFIDRVTLSSSVDFQTKVLPYIQYLVERKKYGRDAIATVFSKNISWTISEKMREFDPDSYIPTDNDLCIGFLTFASGLSPIDDETRALATIINTLKYIPSREMEIRPRKRYAVLK